jgi:hypothetical protein
MYFDDNTLPDDLQVCKLIADLNSKDYLGVPEEKHAFAYAITTAPTAGRRQAILSQLKVIDLTARAHEVHVPCKQVFLDVAAKDFTTHRLGLDRLMVATKSPLFDGNIVIVESPGRLSRMPDEQAALEKGWNENGIRIMYHTTMPAAAMAELDQYYKTEYRSGFSL